MARPRKSIDPAQVEKLAAAGCTVGEMASVLDCDRRTLQRRFGTEMEKGRERGDASLRHRQYQRAMAGDRTMLIWLGKQRLGQRDKLEQIGMTHEQAHAFARQIGEIVQAHFGPLTKSNAEVAAAMSAFCQTMEQLEKAPEGGGEN